MSKKTNSETPTASLTKEITLQTLAITVSTPYVAGHVVTEAEAAALNQTRCEAVRNNTARFVKAALETAGKDEEGNQIALDQEALDTVVAQVSDYDDAYQFTLASVGGGKTSRDPVDVEAMRMAKSLVADKVRKAGKKLGDFTKDQLATVYADTAADENVRAVAAANVKQRQALATASLGDALNLD
jgi:hypothetical protein